MFDSTRWLAATVFGETDGLSMGGAPTWLRTTRRKPAWDEEPALSPQLVTCGGQRFWYLVHVDDAKTQ
jgi:hypothetical protein